MPYLLAQPLMCDEGRVFAVSNPGNGNLVHMQPDFHPLPTAADFRNARRDVGEEMAEQAVVRARQTFTHGETPEGSYSGLLAPRWTRH